MKLSKKSHGLYPPSPFMHSSNFKVGESFLTGAYIKVSAAGWSRCWKLQKGFIKTVKPASPKAGRLEAERRPYGLLGVCRRLVLLRRRPTRLRFEIEL
jgi:hypothetical protein